MPLKIIREADPIEVTRLTLCIYSPPGLGKTSTAFTASRPLLMDFDQGAYRSAFRRDSVQVSSWSEVENVAADDLADYDTVIIDTAGRALDALSSYLIEKNPKLKGYGGALSLQGYGALKTTFIGWLKQIHSYGKDVVLIAHSDEQKKGDEVIERLDVQGGSKNEIYKSADAMARISVEQGKRYLNFNPTDTAFGKNPAGLAVLSIPDFSMKPDFLATVISGIKLKLNEKSEAQKKAVSEMADWKAKFDEAKTVDDFNKLIPQCANVSEGIRDNVKRLLVKIAKDKGINFDRSAATFKQKAA